MRFRNILRAVFVLAALAALTGSRRKPKSTTSRGDSPEDAVEEAGLGSFPASDPPSWTLGEDDKD